MPFQKSEYISTESIDQFASWRIAKDQIKMMVNDRTNKIICVTLRGKIEGILKDMWEEQRVLNDEMGGEVNWRTKEQEESERTEITKKEWKTIKSDENKKKKENHKHFKPLKKEQKRKKGFRSRAPPFRCFRFLKRNHDYNHIPACL